MTERPTNQPSYQPTVVMRKVTLTIQIKVEICKLRKFVYIHTLKIVIENVISKKTMKKIKIIIKILPIRPFCNIHQTDYKDHR